MLDKSIFNDDAVNVASGHSWARFYIWRRAKVPFCFPIQRIDGNTAGNVDRLGHIFDIFEWTLNTVENWAQNTGTKFNW